MPLPAVPTALKRSIYPHDDAYTITTPQPTPQSSLPPPLPDSSPPTFDPDGETANNLINMYFLILAGFAIVLLFGLWYWRRGKKIKQLVSAGRRRSALEQDLELGQQRGGWLGGMRRREEGMDERGEAPPPYTAGGTATEVQMPARTLGREEMGLPKYEEPEGGSRGEGAGAGSTLGVGDAADGRL